MTLAVLEVASGVFVVEASHTSFVLVTDGDEVTLVDSGYPGDRALIGASLARVGRRLTDVTALLLTHAHVDHSGSAEWLRAHHGVPVHCHADEAAHARGEVTQVIATSEMLRRIWRPGVASFVANAVRNGALRPDHVRQVSTFDDGDVIDAPGRPTAVHTPGHTTGHACLHLPDRGVLLAGDALVTVDVWRPTRRGPQLIHRPFNHDDALARASLSRIADIDASIVVTGHGPPFHGSPGAAVAIARARAR